MQLVWLTSILSFLFILPGALALEDKSPREVRTYMSFSYPVDPAQVAIVPDLTLSNALASSLIEWDFENEISSNIAESWQIISPKVYRFTLKKSAKWSNGTPITANDIKRSLDRSFRIHAENLKSFIQLIDRIEVRSEKEIEFNLKVLAKDLPLPEKLAKPQFGIVRLEHNGRPDLSVTSGPYVLDSKSNQNELLLVPNHEWFKGQQRETLPSRIIIRRTPKESEPESVLLTDSWPNFIETFSVMKSNLELRYSRDRFDIWKGPLNNLMSIQLGKRFSNPDGRALIQALQARMNPSYLLTGLTGFSFTNQVFPRGFPYYDPDFSCPRRQTAAVQLTSFSTRPLEILLSHSRVQQDLARNIGDLIFGVTGIRPHFNWVELDKLHEEFKLGNFDLYIGTITIGNPDQEAGLSILFESDAPLIYPNGNHYAERLRGIFRISDRAKRQEQVQNLLQEALCEGTLLPLFHLSSVAIAKDDIDLRRIPESAESISLSEIRFRGISP